MSGHTSGPWSWSNGYQTMDGRKTWSLIGADGYGILSCDGEENAPQDIGDLANASLIAAAPDLLDALKSIVSDYEFCKAHPAWGDRGEQYAETARAAIASATGEQA